MSLATNSFPCPVLKLSRKSKGEQAQVDFGETVQETPEKKKTKLYFIAFVLFHSGYKYMEWLDRPFTTRDVINVHEKVFQW